MLTEEELAGVADRLRDAGVHVAGALKAEQIAGGRSNLTFRIDDGVHRWVLRTPPRAGRTPSAHDVAREFRVTAALADAAVPVPPAVLLCEDEALLGGPFTVSGFVDGTTLRSRDQLGELDDATVGTVVSQLLATLVALHRVDHVEAGLGGFGRPDGYAERQVRRWRSQWELVGPASLRVLARDCFDALEVRLPPQSATGVVHGDYRIDNTILDLGAAPRVAAIVDWELSTIGDPVADVAMMCAYRHPAFDLVFGEPSAWASERIPTPDSLVAAYETLRGLRLDHWEFHRSLALVKVAVIAAGIDHRYRSGVGSGPGFETSGQAVAPYLEAAAASRE